jgi:hypothetical protein
MEKGRKGPGGKKGKGKKSRKENAYINSKW